MFITSELFPVLSTLPTHFHDFFVLERFGSWLVSPGKALALATMSCLLSLSRILVMDTMSGQTPLPSPDLHKSPPADQGWVGTNDPSL